MPKPGAKAPSPTTRKRKKPAKATPPANTPAAQPPEPPKDWPPDLDDTTAESLFEAIENGSTVKKAAEDLGMKGNRVYQWKHRYTRFAARLIEAEDIGIEMMADEEIEIADGAFDRDSAAAAKERREARQSYRRIKRPEKFHTNPFKPAGNNPDGPVFGVVLLPALPSQAPRQAIEGEVVAKGPAALAGPAKKPLRLTPNGF